MAGLDPHYLWALGHITTLLVSLRVGLGVVTFRTISTAWYRSAYVGALLSYAIVCFKSLGKPSVDVAWLQKALLDENVQYLILALYWAFTKPIKLTLLPFFTFSLFHVLTFIRANVIPKLVGPKPTSTTSATPTTPHPAEKVGKLIQAWVKGNYNQAMTVVSYTELAILVRVVAGALVWQNSWLTVVFVAHFLRLRYYHSTFTRSSINNLTSKLDAQVAGLKNPAVTKYYDLLKSLIKKWAGTILTRKPESAASPATAAPKPTVTPVAAGAAR